jgi:hypothetical protein
MIAVADEDFVSCALGAAESTNTTSRTIARDRSRQTRAGGQTQRPPNALHERMAIVFMIAWMAMVVQIEPLRL